MFNPPTEVKMNNSHISGINYGQHKYLSGVNVKQIKIAAEVSMFTYILSKTFQFNNYVIMTAHTVTGVFW